MMLWLAPALLCFISSRMFGSQSQERMFCAIFSSISQGSCHLKHVPMLRWFCSRGYVLVFAAAEGETALEPKHEHLRNGYFTGALLEQLAAIGHCKPLSKVVEAVLDRVHQLSLGLQKPAVYRTAKEDLTVFELLGYRPLPSAGTQASLRDVVLPLCDVFARQVCFVRGQRKVKCGFVVWFSRFRSTLLLLGTCSALGSIFTNAQF